MTNFYVGYYKVPRNFEITNLVNEGSTNVEDVVGMRYILSPDLGGKDFVERNVVHERLHQFEESL